MDIRQASARDNAAIEAVLDAAFGSDRHQRTAYRVRKGMKPIAELSYVAKDKGELKGSLQCWPVELRSAEGSFPLVMLGPVAVLPPLQGTGIGKALIRHALQRADALQIDVIMLIGDPEYYGLFGFEAAPAHGWELPGPFERHRLLVRLRKDTALPAKGMVGPRESSDKRV